MKNAEFYHNDNITIWATTFPFIVRVENPKKWTEEFPIDKYQKFP